ncbi:hypothetical protein AeRB84_014936 [Aphanomyces euteiches]|nr:hypothetical protein AeRB84_014936 [Aphanomyces euteiches]
MSAHSRRAVGLQAQGVVVSNLFDFQVHARGVVVVQEGTREYRAWLLFFSATLNRGHGRVTYGPSACFVGLFCLDLDFLIICTTNRALFHDLMVFSQELCDFIAIFINPLLK